MTTMSSPALALLVLVLLCDFPDSAPANFLENPLADLFGKANATAAAPAASATPNAITSAKKSSKPAAPAPSAPKKAEDPAAKAERLKQQQQLKEIEAQSKAYAKEHGLVSPTNFTGTYKGMTRDFMRSQNAVRARYGAPPLRWDNKLARHARRWGNAMRKDCEFKHSGKLGESIYQKDGNWNATALDAVASWCKEESIYNKDTGECTGGRPFSECGHFALMVAKVHTKVGCARSECYRSGNYHAGVFISCNYQ